MQTGAYPVRSGAVHQQGIGGDQQDLEEDEEIEQVAGEEGAVDAQQLKLEQRMEIRAAGIVAAAGVEHRAGGQYRHGEQHQRGQAIQQQDDAEGRRPVAQGVDLQLTATGPLQEQHRQRQQGPGGEQRQPARGPGG